MKFSHFLQLNEAGPMGGMPMPPPGGGMGGPPLPPPGGIGGGMGLPPPGGGLGAPPPPMGGPMGGMGGQQPTPMPSTEIKTKDVWELLEKLLSGKQSADQEIGGSGQKPKSGISQPA